MTKKLSPFSETRVELEKKRYPAPKNTHTTTTKQQQQTNSSIEVFTLMSSTSSRLQVRQNMFSEGYGYFGV